MPGFPTLPPRGERSTGRRGRITQRDIQPTATRRRHQVGDEREFAAIVSNVGMVGDFSDIQQAINFTNNLGGGTVFIKNGTYAIKSDIELFSNISLVGEDSDNTILDFQQTTKSIRAIGVSATYLNNILISGLKIQNCFNITFGAIDFQFVNDSTIKDCYFVDNWDSGNSDGRDVYLDNARRLNINECRSETGGYFIHVDQTGGSQVWNIKIDRNFSSNSNSGFCNGVGRESFITRNYITQTVAAADVIKIYASDTNSTISNNLMRRQTTTGYFVYLDTTNVKIVNNHFLNFHASAIHMMYLDSFVKNNIITNNIFDSNGTLANQAAIYMNSDCDDNIVMGNQINGHHTGVTIANANCDDNMITNNFFSGHTTDVNNSGTNTQDTDNKKV